MASHKYRLNAPPEDARERELWLQNVAGFILFEDVVRYAQMQLGPYLSAEEREVSLRAIEHAFYGILMMADGVSGSVRSAQGVVSLGIVVRRLREVGGEWHVVEQLDLADSDGACLAFDHWRQGDFGTFSPVAQDNEGEGESE